MNYYSNVELQERWCTGQSDAIRNGARSAVDLCHVAIGANAVPVGRVAEIGPQFGFGMERWTELGVPVIGFELVPSFANACKDKGLICHEIAAEKIHTMPEMAGQVFNWYLRDTLEHLYDASQVVNTMLNHLDRWIYVSVPVEPVPGKDKAHLSRIVSREAVYGMFPGMRCINEKYRAPDHRPGRIEGIWIKG